jgi:NAD(P)H dehydrogenase (quinone)
MRVFVLYANPVETSFGAALHRQIIDALRARGHEVDDCDLYAEGFDPLTSRQERIDYHDPALNRARVAPYVDRLLAAQGLVLVFPVWNYGFPAILKGFIDKVFLPGVSFDMESDGSYRPRISSIKKLAAVCTYGGNRWRTMLMGDPPRKVVKRSLRSLFGLGATCRYLAHYDMNHTTIERRQRFLSEVKRAFEAW